MLSATASNATQLYTKKTLTPQNRDCAAGGTGTLHASYSFTREDAKTEDAIKEIGWMTLLEGDSVGMHTHTDNEDAYIIVSGTATFTDTTGKEYTVHAGDL